QDAHEMRRNNRQAQLKIGGTPWDAPETSNPSASTCAAAQQQAAAGAPSARAARSEALAEAKRYRERMHGSQDLISGNYWAGNAQQNQSLPTPGTALLPG
ncbi:unnamed protein product, partial [Effrenium voratum]